MEAMPLRALIVSWVWRGAEVMINSAVALKMLSVSSLVGDWIKMKAEEREELSTSVRNVEDKKINQ